MNIQEKINSENRVKMMNRVAQSGETLGSREAAAEPEIMIKKVVKHWVFSFKK
jgi:hypothetical protein